MYAPEVWGNGAAMVEFLLNQNPNQNFVFSILVLKLLATLAAVGSGAVGGIFTPTLFVGAAVGWLYSHELQVFFPALNTDTVTYAALGMGAFLSGASHAPVMSILMIFEMTQDADLLFPLIVVAMSARYLSTAIRPVSVYAQSLGDVKTHLPYLMLVADLQVKPASVVTEDITAEKVSEIFCLSPVQHIWVTDATGHYLGAIALHNMKRFLGDPKLKHLNASMVFMEDDVPTVYQDTALTDVLAIFAKSDTDRLPIVDANRSLLGDITKTDLLLTLS
jgi:CIC family chloride channel protein